MKKFLNTSENAFALFSLVYFSGIFNDLVPMSVIQLFRYFVWLLSMVLCCVHWKSTLYTASRSTLIWIVNAFIVLSFIWADNPVIALKDNREVVQMISFSLYFASRFSLRQQVKLIGLTLFIGACASLASGIVLPSVGLHQDGHKGAWKGLYGYKNNLGSMMVLLAATMVTLPKESCKGFYKLAGIFLAVLLILLCTSKTSLTISVIMTFILLFYRNFRWQGKISVLIVDLVVLITGTTLFTVLTNWVALLTAMNKDVTMTGRIPMWTVALYRLMERPFLGFGRSMFWSPGSKYAVEAGAAVSPGYLPPHAHNGFVDMALDIGLIGFSFFIICFLAAYIKSLRIAYAADDPENAWPLAFLMFLFMNNITENYLLFKVNIYWILFMSTVLTVSKIRLGRDFTADNQSETSLRAGANI